MGFYRPAAAIMLMVLATAEPAYAGNLLAILTGAGFWR